jgi:transposase
MTYSLDIINLAITYLVTNTQLKKISEILKITRQTINIWSKKYKQNIKNNIPVTQQQINENKKIHKNNKINIFLNDVNIFIEQNNGCSLNDIYLHINKKISKASIINIVKKLNITHKKINNHIVCKEISTIMNERKIFAENMNWNINEVIYIDESSFCVNEIKNYGYAKKGKKINILYKHKQNKQRYTLLAAISNQHIVEYEIINGSVDKYIYLNFIKKINEKFKNKIIIQDNARIHHAIILKEYALKENILLKYNPAYTPEFNPIELMFNKCKNNFKKLDHTNIIEDIKISLNTITHENCQHFYDHANKIINTYK